MKTDKTEIVAIVALGDGGQIGRGGELLWRIREDLQRFKRLTSGHPVVMGRKTWESLPKPLPGRTNIVVTRQEGYAAPGGVVCHSLKDAIQAAAEAEGGEKVYIIGGGEIYRQAMPYLDSLELTHVCDSPEADTWFPEISTEEWETVGKSDIEATQNGLEYAFETLKRKERL